MAESVTKLAQDVRAEMAKGVVGQQQMVDQLLWVLLCRGHVLLEGVPGLAKTLAVKILARILQLRFQRVQCTPDLMPADVLGTNVFNPASATFSFRAGPILTDLLLVDEINRTPPRTQSALLEAMEEKQVTVDGTRHLLPRFFTVFATQNPIEFEGTYPLPEAQLDRFLMKIRVAYPQAAQEAEILQLYDRGFDPHELDKLNLSRVDTDSLAEAQAEVSRVRVEPALFDYVATIVRRTREWPSLSLGASPRAAVCLLLVAKAHAAMEGREYLIPDDVKAVALPVLRHRVLLKPEAELEGLGSDPILTEVLAGVEVPK